MCADKTRDEIKAELMKDSSWAVYVHSLEQDDAFADALANELKETMNAAALAVVR